MVKDRETSNTQEKRHSGGSVALLEPALWRALTEATNELEFCLSWLELEAHMVGGVASGMVGFGSTEVGDFRPTAFYPRDLEQRNHFTTVIDRVFKERKGVVLNREETATGEPSGPRTLLVGYPLWLDGQLAGIAALEISARAAAELQTLMRQLQWGSAWLQTWLLRQQAKPKQETIARLETVLELSLRTLEDKRYRAAAVTAVTELAMRLECDRVSIGYLRGRQAKIGALSHSAQIGREMNLIRSISAAMNEAMDQGRPVVFPTEDDQAGVIVRAHAELAEQLGETAICTIPFLDADGEAYGALTVERKGAAGFSEDFLTLCEAAANFLGPVLEEKRLNDRNIVFKLTASFASGLAVLLGPRHLLPKVIVLALAGLIVYVSVTPGDYRVTAKSTLEGQVQRAVVAPFNGYLYQAEARAGDLVRAGQMLAAMDDRDLRLERSKWASRQAQYQLEYQQAMAEGETAAAKIANEQARQAEIQLNLLEEQIERAQIVAPFDGIVVSGDLSQDLGRPLDIGATLFEVAPLDHYRIKLQVDERDIDQIRVSQTGQLILNALPDQSFSFAVTKITPVSLAEEGVNYFVVEASLEQGSEMLRPRMEGFGKIMIGERRLIWIWTHELIDWVRLWLWTWWP